MDQPGKVAKSARGQLNRENEHSPVPRTSLHETTCVLLFSLNSTDSKQYYFIDTLHCTLLYLTSVSRSSHITSRTRQPGIQVVVDVVGAQSVDVK